MRGSAKGTESASLVLLTTTRSVGLPGGHMLKGFKDFLLRGNVVDLAVAVVVGAAFTAIVTAFTSNIVNPMVAALGG
ncbi:MAG: MscL family protein, partial [Rhodococcus sp. (in: high G+C Gram-positive bacteria)]